MGSPVAIFNRTSGTDGIGIANQWQLLVAVMDKENRKLYLNGELVSQSTSPTSLITLEGNDGRIGSWDEDSGADFEGQIDELRIYGTSFSQADVNALWNLGSGDLGIVPVVDMSTDHSAAEINGTIRFYQVGNQVMVSGFDASDISIQGASLGNFSEDGSTDEEVSNREHEFHLHFPPISKIEKFLQKRKADDFFPMSRKALPIQSGKYESFHGGGRPMQKE